ncbi:hypothetical protein [Actinomyces viscosus]|nr:hypothetical protein [Actinomyces viscosus]
MYHQLVAIIENKDDELQHPSSLVDAKDKPPPWIVFIVQRA